MKTQSKPITQIEPQDTHKISVGVTEIDELLAGGLTKGQVIMLAGQPGCGKSTLVTQISKALSIQGNKVLYVSGEESLPQIRSRADRLNAVNDNIICAEAVGLEQIIQTANYYKPVFMVVDSLQMIHSAMLKQAPSSPTQMRFCLDKLIDYAKTNGIIMLVIGHSTKTGIIAGLLALQHMVDTVLFMTTDITNVRKLQVYKNRYGEANVATELTMDTSGFREFNHIKPTTIPISIPAAQYINQNLQAAGKQINIYKMVYDITSAVLIATLGVTYGVAVYLLRVGVALPGIIFAKPSRGRKR
jgi:DNA repair protein RadA/Sms